MHLAALSGCDPELQVYTLSNDQLRLAFLPSCGGRLLGIEAFGQELLWQNPRLFDPSLRPRLPRTQWPPDTGTLANWANPGGSKTWPAPEGPGPGQWPGPPEPVLEMGPWLISHAAQPGAVAVTMTSPFDPATGLVIRRTYQLPTSGTTFTEVAHFTNASDTARTWSVWEVCQVATARGPDQPTRGVIEVAAPSGTEGRVVAQAHGSVDLPVARQGWHRLAVPDFVGKVSFAQASGEVAYVDDAGPRLRLHFEPQEGLAYPNDSRVDLWMQVPLADGLGPEFRYVHPRDNYIELEVLSPLTRLEPGDSVSLALTWQVDLTTPRRT